MDWCAQCFRLKEFNLHLRNDICTADNIIYKYEKSTVQHASVGLAQARPNDSLLATLEDVSEGVDRAKAIEATGLLLQIKSFKFFLSLIMFDRILTCTRSLSDYLQHAQVNLAKAADLVSATVSTLELFRTDEEAQENRG